MLQGAGFAAPSIRSWKTAIDFSTWIARIGTPLERVAALRTVMPALPCEVRDYFKISPECSFELDSAWMASPKPA